MYKYRSILHIRIHMGPRYKCIYMHYIYVRVCVMVKFIAGTCVNLIGVFGVRWFSLGHRARGGVLCRPPAVGSVYMTVLYTHTHTSGRASVHGTGFGSIFKHTHKCVYILLYMHVYMVGSIPSYTRG